MRFTAEPTPALVEMLSEDAARGVHVVETPPPPAPPVKNAPLVRPLLPPPDWRGDEDARARRKATKAAKRAEPESTPNLDRVRAWGRGAP